MNMGINSKTTRMTTTTTPNNMKEDILEHLEKVYEGCEMHMNQLDNDGYCAESDDYVVALHFVREYIESLKSKKKSVPWAWILEDSSYLRKKKKKS